MHINNIISYRIYGKLTIILSAGVGLIFVCLFTNGQPFHSEQKITPVFLRHYGLLFEDG